MNPNLISYCSSRLFTNSSLGCVTNRLTDALLTTNPLCNNRLVIDWRRCAWKYEQLRKTSLYVPLCSFMAGTRAFAIFLISAHKSFMIEFWNETKFHFLLVRDFIDTLDQALFFSLSPLSLFLSLYYVIRKTNVCLVMDSRTMLG